MNATRHETTMNVMNRQAYHFEDLEVGMEASFAKTVSSSDIVAFAEVTGDRTPSISMPPTP
jgi:3-hydroxybutyryl-CoA dehydratase